MQPGEGTESELSAKMFTCSIPDYSFPQAVGFSGLPVPSYVFPYYSNSYMMPLYTLVEDEPSIPLWDGGRAQGQWDKSWIAVTHSQSICLSLTHTCLSVTHTHTHTHTHTPLGCCKGPRAGLLLPTPSLSVCHSHTYRYLSVSLTLTLTHTHPYLRGCKPQAMPPHLPIQLLFLLPTLILINSWPRLHQEHSVTGFSPLYIQFPGGNREVLPVIF